MVIVNPYSKKKKKTASSPATSIGGGSRPLPSIVPQSLPSRVTPNGKQAVVGNAERKIVGGNSHVSPSSRHQRSGKFLSSRVDNTTATIARGRSRSLIATTSSKAKLSVKQRLKQEIAALKKQKQLKKLQREADERRRRRLAEKKVEEDRRLAFLTAKEEERQRKQAERDRLTAIKQQERIRKQQEREQKQREKEQERERKREEKIRKQEEKWKRQEEILKQQRQKAEEKYQRDLNAWKEHQRCWMQQQQRLAQQFHYGISYQHQMGSYVKNHLYCQPQHIFQDNFSDTSLSTPLQLPRKTTETQDFSKKEILSVEPDTTHQKISTPTSSSFGSSSAVVTNKPMNSVLLPPQVDTVNDNEASKDIASNDAKLRTSPLDHASSRELISEGSTDHDKNCAQVSIDAKDEQIANFDSPIKNDVQNQRTESNNSAPLPAPKLTELPSGTKISTCTDIKRIPKQLDEHKEPALLPPMSTTSSQDSRKNQYSLQPTMGYRGSIPYHRTHAEVTTTFYGNPMLNVFNPSNLAGSFLWVPPPPPPPVPPMFWQTKPLRRLSAIAQRSKRPKPSAPSLLCNPMKDPSPFANQDRYLVTVLLIRDPRTELSFGVNLKLYTESALVDPQWVEEQKRVGLKPKPDKNQRITSNEPPINEADNLAASTVVNSSLVTLSAQMPSQNVAIKNSESQMNVSDKISAVGDPIGIMIPAMSQKLHCSDIKQERDESTWKVDPAVPKKNLSSAPMNKMIHKHKTKDDSFKHGDDDNIKEVVNSCLDFLVSSVAEKAVATSATTLVRKRKKRRRRVNFSIMQVVDADKQNTRNPDLEIEKKLHPGDIVVSVQGHELTGMTFKDACKVFSKNAENVSDSLIQTEVVVARKKGMVAPILSTSEGNSSEITPMIVAACPPSSTPVIAPRQPENTSMVFSPTEMAILSNCVFQTLHSTNRVLGLDIQDSAWHLHSIIFRMAPLQEDTGLTPRASTTLKSKWSHLTRFIDHDLVEKGTAFWKLKFSEEFGDEKIPFASDVERNALRHLPRPPKGCRCGRNDHEYVFDPKCVLYRDLQKRLSTQEIAKLRQGRRKKNNSMQNEDLNVVESAFKNRIVKLKVATEKESIDTRFVKKMEEVQVKELHKAIYAPNLTTIVLSTMFELQREFQVSMEGNKENVESDAEDDDDVPLDCLGERKQEDQLDIKSKKQQKVASEGDLNLSLHYLIRMLEFVSKTWGHCYREPSREEFAWRWELFHAVHSHYDQWDAHATNPRVPGSFPFENVRFGFSASKSMREKVSSLRKSIRQFEDSIIANTHTTFDFPNEVLDQFCLTIHLLSPARTGIYDEVIALSKMGIFKVSPSGIPVFTEDWWTKIDVHVLDEMNLSWSTEVDPDSRHCVNEEFRDTLEEKWLKSEYGWSLLENPKELIFDFAILDEWQETFESRLEEKENFSEGIGRFGL